MSDPTLHRPHADKRMPSEVKDTLLDLIEGDPSLEERVARLTERHLANSPSAQEGGYSTAQRSAATGFARKVLAQELGLWEPDGHLALEVTDDFDVEAALRPRRRSRGLSAKERRAVETRAVEVARRELEVEWEVEDVGAWKSYDLECTNAAGDLLIVEVKGTTGRLNLIDLTANEVKVARSMYPRTALFVVHGIRLERDPQLRATGGALHRVRPWQPDDQLLEPTAYRYRVG